MDFRSAYDGLQADVSADISVDTSADVVMTKQEFKDECDINTIMGKYVVTGQLPFDGTSPGQYGDYTNVPDLLEAQLIVKQSAEDFEALPSAVRERFANDPVRLMRFLSDESNREEAIKLGLIVPPPPVVAEPVGDVAPAPPPKAAGTAG